MQLVWTVKADLDPPASESALAELVDVAGELEDVVGAALMDHVEGVSFVVECQGAEVRV